MGHRRHRLRGQLRRWKKHDGGDARRVGTLSNPHQRGWDEAGPRHGGRDQRGGADSSVGGCDFTHDLVAEAAIPPGVR